MNRNTSILLWSACSSPSISLLPRFVLFSFPCLLSILNSAFPFFPFPLNVNQTPSIMRSVCGIYIPTGQPSDNRGDVASFDQKKADFTARLSLYIESQVPKEKSIRQTLSNFRKEKAQAGEAKTPALDDKILKTMRSLFSLGNLKLMINVCVIFHC